MSAGAVLITGGAGFIGSNLAARLAELGRDVVLFDNFSREGVHLNAAWLCSEWPKRIRVEPGDVRDRRSVARALEGVTEVYHFAAQVAVTDSIANPAADFEINARGTLNVLEAVRDSRTQPSLLFTSTNKIYGDLGGLDLGRSGGRYMPVSATTGNLGISERQPLSFHSPYGCSKGAADQYVLDYGRVYGLRTAVFRMSCIYGPHQFGTEDQGWVAHFLICSIDGRPLTIYGDGMQVRDVLYVDDLVDALMLAQQRIDALADEAFNIGGGPANTISLLELMDLIATLNADRPRVRFSGWRRGDQRYYVSDTRQFTARTGWAPRTGVREGVTQLHQWLLEARGLTRPATLAGRGMA